MFAIGILVFDGVDLLDIAAPHEVFSTASRLHRQATGQQERFRSFLIADRMQPVRARGGMRVLPDCVLLPSADNDVLIVPGGETGSLATPALLAWIAGQVRAGTVVAALGAGSLLVDPGNRMAGVTVVAGRRLCAWREDGKLVTAEGRSAAIEMSLHLLERLAGSELALATARELHYGWMSAPAPALAWPVPQARRDVG